MGNIAISRTELLNRDKTDIDARRECVLDGVIPDQGLDGEPISQWNRATIFDLEKNNTNSANGDRRFRENGQKLYVAEHMAVSDQFWNDLSDKYVEIPKLTTYGNIQVSQKNADGVNVPTIVSGKKPTFVSHGFSISDKLDCCLDNQIPPKIGGNGIQANTRAERCAPCWAPDTKTCFSHLKTVCLEKNDNGEYNLFTDPNCVKWMIMNRDTVQSIIDSDPTLKLASIVQTPNTIKGFDLYYNRLKTDEGLANVTLNNTKTGLLNILKSSDDKIKRYNNNISLKDASPEYEEWAKGKTDVSGWISTNKNWLIGETSRSDKIQKLIDAVQYDLDNGLTTTMARAKLLDAEAKSATVRAEVEKEKARLEALRLAEIARLAKIAKEEAEAKAEELRKETARLAQKAIDDKNALDEAKRLANPTVIDTATVISNRTETELKNSTNSSTNATTEAKTKGGEEAEAKAKVDKALVDAQKAVDAKVQAEIKERETTEALKKATQAVTDNANRAVEVKKTEEGGGLSKNAKIGLFVGISVFVILLMIGIYFYNKRVGG
jgi:hypothetical protein